MKTAFFVAKRYLISRKKHHVINVISLISLIGITVGTAALIVVLSVFNGMEDLIIKNFNSFNPDFLITKKEGKSFPISEINKSQIYNIKGVTSVEEVISDLVLFSYDDKQYIVFLKGVSPQYVQDFGLKDIIEEGKFEWSSQNDDVALVGSMIASDMNLGLSQNKLLKVYYPKRHKTSFANPTDAFNTQFLYPTGVFSSYTDYDHKYIFASINFVRDLTDYQDEVTQIEIKIKNHSDQKRIQKSLKTLLGDSFNVKNKYEQEELMFKTMKIEKLATFSILAFILLIAAFNVVGSLTMLILEKKQDFKIWYSFGASENFIKRIFLIEGMLLSLLGGLAGMVIAFIICFIQWKFHVITLPNADVTDYVINYYPVLMQASDFLCVLLIIVVISLTASWLPVRKISIRS